ncbi:Uncharacterised protein [Faecalicoccus pleomorphus]|uniref:Gram-positive cocci surface proteins LPxTG domain-containing protein n=3 Tax=Faecalicoccus pleomorphus TaxID=1323 RepID=A0A380LNJ4_9FIRM|nr:hypothetical protein [Faecalicoccus pleomorphus]SUO04813.1 Uncharacterised protein [Faecalicoccus pleomorphus]
MNRKKITKAALSGLVAVTMVPAMAAPLVANAEGNDATAETQQSTVTMNIQFKCGEEVIAGGDYTVPEGVQNYSVLQQYVPAGYQMTTTGDFYAKEGDKLTVNIEKVNTEVSMKIQFKCGEEVVAGGDYFVPAGVQNYSVLQQYVPAGYQMTTTGDFYAEQGGKLVVNIEKIISNVTMNIRFVDKAGSFIGGGDYTLPEGVQNYSILQQYVPEGYKMTVSGDFMVVAGGSEEITVESEYDGTILNFVFVDANGNNVGSGDVIVDEDKDGIFNWKEVNDIVPEGYQLDLSGDAFVGDYIGNSNTIAVSKIYKASIIKLQFVDEAGEVVGGGDYFVDEDGDGIFNWKEVELPAGYAFNETGDAFVKDFSADDATQVKVHKIQKGTIINVVFEDPQGNNLGGGDFLVDLDGDGIANYSELALPVGYKLNVTGDFFVEEGGHYTVVLNREGAAIIHVVFKSQGGKNLGGGDYFVDEDGDGIFNYSELTLPEGYELSVTGDEFVDTEKTYEIVLNKEIEGTIINVVYVDKEGNNLGGGDFFVDPDDDGIANYSELDLPEGYELIVTGDFFVTPGKSYTITLHKITEEETAAATLVVRYVDQENGNEVVLEKTYDDQVGPVGETATYIEDVVVPEGYELVQDIEGIAADVEYGQTKVMYVFVTKTAQEPTQPGDEEEPNTPAEGTEESEQTDGTDTGVAMSLAGVFGTMSAALAGMVALLRRKQK